MATFLERMRTLGPQLDWGTFDSEAEERLERFAAACPLYAEIVTQSPEIALWLETREVRFWTFRFQELLHAWRAFRDANGGPDRESPAYPGLLRRFRRRMSMRIAYRDVTDTAPQSEIVEELTRLAEFCLRECLFIAHTQWTRRLGEPWDDVLGQPARFCIFGLGKLGGQELNFSSDIDLIYVHEGDGYTRRDERATNTSNLEFYQRLGETITQLLNERDANGFLFRADLRLRPGGPSAQLVPALEAVENYYAATGQIWERLALIKARPVAGDLDLGAEMLESLHSYRYPRHPPPSLFAEVAAMKRRTEREIVGTSALERDLKSGLGGIREIEFFAQAMQLLHAGRYPFLQTDSTTGALSRLVRYELLDARKADFLQQAYWQLRRVEHRIQMLDESQTHELPADPQQRARIARTLGFTSLDRFDKTIAETRAGVRECYTALFRESEPVGSPEFDAWWRFFADGDVSDTVRAHLTSWFGNPDEAAKPLRLFVRESEAKPLMRDQVRRFIDIIPALDRVVRQLATPLATLNRISIFAERCSSRTQFLSTCAMNREFVEVLALLFDRSTFTHDLLTRHPEIIDEVLRPEILRKRKNAAARARELDGFEENGAKFEDWLWLYVRAEQVRAAIGQLLGYLEEDEVTEELTALAESVVCHLVRRAGNGHPMLVVALGKLGGGELTFGSDLDLLFITEESAVEETELTVRAVRKFVGRTTERDATFVLDLRLRPFGDDGPLVTDLPSFHKYFRESAQLWEKQALTRTRVICGPRSLALRFQEMIAEILHQDVLTTADADTLWRMRLRVQHERDVVTPPERAFKTGAGGLIDVEFTVQLYQLRHGRDHPAIRTPDTTGGLRALATAGIVPAEDAERLLANFRWLKRIEFVLRRNVNRGVSVIPESPTEQRALAKWLGIGDWNAFWHEHCKRMGETRTLTLALLRGLVSSTTLEPDR